VPQFLSKLTNSILTFSPPRIPFTSTLPSKPHTLPSNKFFFFSFSFTFSHLGTLWFLLEWSLDQERSGFDYAFGFLWNCTVLCVVVVWFFGLIKLPNYIITISNIKFIWILLVERIQFLCCCYVMFAFLLLSRIHFISFFFKKNYGFIWMDLKNLWS